MEKNISGQILAVVTVHFFFIFALVLGISYLREYSLQKDARVIGSSLDISQLTDLQFSAAGNSKVVTYDISSGVKHRKERLFHPIILQEAKRYKIDPCLVKAIIMAESGYNPKAISKRGAKGLMQLMPSTAEALGVVDIFNPKQNISGGIRYFKQLVKRFDGNVKLALAAYNAGSQKVRHYQGIPPFKATQYYIEKVFKYYELYKDQSTEKLDKA
ncbi:MAG: lytic transglycosylase domain-containing protein [Desulfobacterales bacterium]|jgi:soluble lytic murein transglycosylase-like protein